MIVSQKTIVKTHSRSLHYEKFADGSIKCIEDEIPFEVPEGWAWCRIRTVFSTITGGTPSTKDRSLYGNEYPFFKPTDLDAGFQVTSADDHVSKKGFTSGRIVHPLSVLVTCIGATIGKTGLVRVAGLCNQQINAILPNPLIVPEYTYFFMCSGFGQEQIISNSSATTLPILNKSRFDSLLFILPPYMMQARIAEQVVQLLHSIDTIDHNQTDIRELVSTTKAHILDLAIRGLLIPQDPNDEPASVLLERIRAEKEELIRQGKIKRDKKESVIFRGEDNSYYLQTGNLIESLSDWGFDDLPDSWAICCLGEICDYGNCINAETDNIDDDAWLLDLEDIEKDTGKVLVRVKKRDRNAASTKHQFHAGQVLYSKLRPYLNKVVLADQDGFCTSEILPLEFECIVVPEYARYYLMSPAFLRYANHCSYGVKMPRLGTADGKKAIVPLPPYKEQERIVKAIHKTFTQLDSIAESLS